MALLFMDSFDHYATADITEKWTAITTVVNGIGKAPIIGAYGRNGTSGLRTATAGGGTDVALGPTITVAPTGGVCLFGAALKYANLSAFAVYPCGKEAWKGGGVGEGSNYIVRCFNNNDALWFARVNTDGTISVLRDPGTTSCVVLGTTTNALQAGVFAYVELKVTVHDSTGTVDVRINGAAGLSLTGQNTRGTGASNAWTNLRVGYMAMDPPTTVNTLDIDDLVAMDGSGARNNAFLGDVTIGCLHPDADGNSHAWVLSTGTPDNNEDYLCVDEALVNDDTDYISTATVNAKSTFSMQDVAAGANVKAVQIVTAQRKAAEGPGLIKHVVRSNSTDYDLTEQGIGGTSYAFLRSVVEVDPATSAAWTESGFNSVEIGIKKTG